MGGLVSQSLPGATDVCCPAGRASHSFPLRISSEAARAASAAALGSATVATVLGYTTQLTREAGAHSVRLQLAPSGSTSAAQVGEEPCPHCAVVSIRSRDRLGFLPGIAALIRPEGSNALLLEVIVFARPDELLQEITQLPEDFLRGLFPVGDRVDVRILRSMTFQSYTGEDSTGAGFGDHPSEADPTEAALSRSEKSEWLAERLLDLASNLEAHFSSARHEPLPDSSYESTEFSAQEIESWLSDAGIRVTGHVPVTGLQHERLNEHAPPG
ncbi:unnamed protein product [Polarella glacialis]|uniref:Uncharacterized protein n=1 Tax=Polarella glacialis TaxID=89957 RepID=A0A813IVH2_POLGL|nr:unnamed protein product [Polarella glacialis]CAE8657276.1 unnamed protein product [Polarella glacialis]